MSGPIILDNTDCPEAKVSNDNRSQEFLTESAGKRSGLVSEFTDFIRHNRKYWMIPIIVVVLALGALVILGGSAAAPFIYTLF